ncbi:MAG TPA: hypothetical protein VH913_04340, partial [Hyphomicrobiaceae bacterium]
MQDAQSPSDAGADSGEQPRRAALKLRDAETVAATRRDMFGDGSLIDSLGGSPKAADEAQGEPGADAAEAGPQEPGLPESAAPEAGAGEPDLPVHQPLPDASADAPPPGPETPPERDAESRDADEKAGRGSGDRREEPRFANPAASPFAQIPQSLDSIIDSFAAEPSTPDPESPAPEPGGPGFVPPPRYGSLAPRAEADGFQSGEAQAAAPAPIPSTMAVSSIFDGLGPAEPATEEDDPAGRALPFGTGSPDIPMPAPPPEVAPPSAGWPGDDLVPTSGERGLDVNDLVSFGLDGHARVGGDAAADSPEQLELPAVPAAPPDPEPAAPEVALPRYAEPPAMRPFPDAIEPPDTPSPIGPIVTAAPGADPEPGERSRYAGASDDPSRPMFEATAKIAAEANATAEALDHLKRLLVQNAPGGEPVRSAADAGPLNLLGDPAQFAIRERVPMLPLPVPPERSRVKGIYLMGFLTGLALSLMAGLALYLL